MEVAQAPGGGVATGVLERVPGQIDTHDLSRGDPLGQTPGDAARTAAHVEEPEAGLELGQEEGGRLCGRPLAVWADSRGSVAVRVGLVPDRLGHAFPARIIRWTAPSVK